MCLLMVEEVGNGMQARLSLGIFETGLVDFPLDRS